MKRVGVLIVDDEPLARDTIRLLLEQDERVNILGDARDGAEAVKAIRDLKPDIVFLDIQMPGMTGLEVIQEIGPDNMPVVVFATAYDEYAIQAFDAAALDYLLKPFDDDRFEKALVRAREAVERRRSGAVGDRLDLLLERLGAGIQSKAPVERLMIKERDTLRFVNTRDIEWIEAAGDYVSIHTAGRSHLLRDTMSAMEEKLDSSRFVRVHRSTIVNLEYVKELKSYFHGDYIVYMTSGKELRLSRRYWDRVQSALGSLDD